MWAAAREGRALEHKRQRTSADETQGAQPFERKEFVLDVELFNQLYDGQLENINRELQDYFLGHSFYGPNTEEEQDLYEWSMRISAAMVYTKRTIQGISAVGFTVRIIS